LDRVTVTRINGGYGQRQSAVRCLNRSLDSESRAERRIDQFKIKGSGVTGCGGPSDSELAARREGLRRRVQLKSRNHWKQQDEGDDFLEHFEKIMKGKRR